MYLEAKDGPQFRNSSKAFHLFQSDVEGECKACGMIGEIDRFQFCLEDDCRHTRLIADLHSGKARKLPDGTLVWIVG
jgi:hypothetical protein